MIKISHANIVYNTLQVDKAIESENETHGTLVHGDVKGANIVFNHDPYPRTKAKFKSRITPSFTTPTSNEATSNADVEPLRCALYDFQYVGLNLPTHDLVYFLGTSVQLSLLKTEEDERALLRVWLDAFASYSRAHQGDTEPDSTRTNGELNGGNISHVYDFDTLWRHWELSILDWYRFMAGWGFWGNDRWVERRAREIVESRRVEKLVQVSQDDSPS